MKRICIIDDQFDIRELLTDLLRNHGYETEAYKNGFEGIERLVHKDFDLIVTDLMMSEQNGFDFIANVRKKHSMPIIVITGGTKSEQHAAEIEKLQAQHYRVLKKPFSPIEFLDAIQSELQ